MLMLFISLIGAFTLYKFPVKNENITNLDSNFKKNEDEEVLNIKYLKARASFNENESNQNNKNNANTSSEDNAKTNKKVKIIAK